MDMSKVIDEQSVKILLAICSLWGAALSTVLGMVTLWEKLWKERVRLATTCSFSGQEGSTDTITIVNLSGATVHVCYWTLAWRRNFFRWKVPSIDVTPDYEEANTFTIAPRDKEILHFEERDKFDWSYRIAKHRQLYLTLHIFGRRKPMVLKVGAGQ